jgi:hypothetical protein
VQTVLVLFFESYEELMFDDGPNLGTDAEAFKVVPPLDSRLLEGAGELLQLLIISVPAGILGSSGPNLQ